MTPRSPARPHWVPDDRTVTEIKDALTSGTPIAEVDRTALQYKRDVFALAESKIRHNRTMVIQIKNLADYRRKMIAQDAGAVIE